MTTKTIRLFRRMLDLSQGEVAGRVGHSQTWLSRIELGLRPLLEEDRLPLLRALGMKGESDERT